MKNNNRLKASIIFAIYLVATLGLLFCGYSVAVPAVKTQEFPFSITYSHQGERETICAVYVAEYNPKAKYIGENAVAWCGYVKDQDGLQSDYCTVLEDDGWKFSINLNMVPGYLMGDPAYADFICQPAGVYQWFDGTNDIAVSDPAELEELGFSIVSWEYPQPIQNSFSFGAISMSSEATIYTAIIAVITLLACVFVIKKDKERKYGLLDKISVILNFLMIIIVFPFILIASALTEIVADTSALQQILYLTPAITVLGVAASVTLRRMGKKQYSFWVQFAGPVLFAFLVVVLSI